LTVTLANTLATVRSTFHRGIHPADEKELSREAPIEVLPTPASIRIPLLQHLGQPCDSRVKPRQEVALGDLLAESESFVSAPVHASVAGKVGRESVATLPNGRHVATLPITPGEQVLEGRELFDDHFGGAWEPCAAAERSPGEIVEAIRAAGVVGMGGATFPTHVKLAGCAERSVDTLLVNACECEPYLNADYRVMLEAPEVVLAGARLAQRAAGAESAIVAIEDNKPEAVRRMREAAADTGVEVRVVRTKYPQGAEKQLIISVLGRIVPGGGLPLDIGVVVINVGTAAAIARAVLRGKPFTHRVVTVTGRGVVRPGNWLAPIGVPYLELLASAGGLTSDAARVLAGGPLMGFTVGSLETPVTKGTSGITVLTHDDLRRATETACVRCGRCVDVCPLSLVPARLGAAARHADWELAERFHIRACMECGCCAYTCPAGIPLVQLIRMGKAEMVNR
jgi:electron transport complex protein RnfC